MSKKETQSPLPLPVLKWRSEFTPQGAGTAARGFGARRAQPQ
jgi:hypothetical protein